MRRSRGRGWRRIFWIIMWHDESCAGLSSVSLCRSAFAIGKGDAGDGAETAEEANAAGDDVKLVAAGFLCLRVEGNILRMLYEDAVATLKHQDEPAKRHCANESLNFASYCLSACHRTSVE